MFGSSSVNYYCMSCGTKHNEVACPKCGSKMKRIG
jgi:DNA-directed RNA polymerase subunit RPC12/RpoP